MPLQTLIIANIYFGINHVQAFAKSFTCIISLYETDDLVILQVKKEKKQA